MNNVTIIGAASCIKGIICNSLHRMVLTLFNCFVPFLSNTKSTNEATNPIPHNIDPVTQSTSKLYY